ncbi:tubulin monoglycylase TTLL3-like [Xenopus laevis]|uniref:Tubulin monoglycylase TTLL3-like n=1 Tax=Xenopus laevis TaxID=8355 RepID=A0A8J1MH75_XENLA|nr:tubulin monoglycylase TTLL3-like [Xenopus laevis]
MITAAHSILKWIARRISTPVQAEETTRKSNTIPFSEDLIVTTLKVCKMCLGTSTNKRVEKEIEEVSPDWTTFVEGYYSIIQLSHNESSLYCFSDGAEIDIPAKYAEQCRHVLDQIEAILPQLDIDAGKNIWILKPAFLSRGRSIRCMNRIDEIYKFLQSRQKRMIAKQWVVQKYIERPFLIYGTKFDLRQFFLVTDWNPLTVWFYKETCCRFSSQPFDLDNLDRSIHLCNRSIQQYLTNCPTRHPDLPEDNLWSNVQLKEYLRMIGAEHAYEEVMVPGMKKAIYYTLQVCQDIVKHRKNSFDIYGADFMFGENFNPWLIEINFRPDTTSQAPVANVIFESLLEDTIKVVIDRRNDPNCDIGAYELLQKQVHFY